MATGASFTTHEAQDSGRLIGRPLGPWPADKLIGETCDQEDGCGYPRCEPDAGLCEITGSVALRITSGGGGQGPLCPGMMSLSRFAALAGQFGKPSKVDCRSHINHLFEARIVVDELDRPAKAEAQIIAQMLDQHRIEGN